MTTANIVNSPAMDPRVTRAVERATRMVRICHAGITECALHAAALESVVDDPDELSTGSAALRRALLENCDDVREVGRALQRTDYLLGPPGATGSLRTSLRTAANLAGSTVASLNASVHALEPIAHHQSGPPLNPATGKAAISMATRFLLTGQETLVGLLPALQDLTDAGLQQPALQAAGSRTLQPSTNWRMARP